MPARRLRLRSTTVLNPRRTQSRRAIALPPGTSSPRGSRKICCNAARTRRRSSTDRRSTITSRRFRKPRIPLKNSPMLTCTPPRGITIRHLAPWKALTVAALLFTGAVRGQPAPPSNGDEESLASAISPRAWELVEQSIERALAWLATTQNADGSFEAPASAQPAATSLVILAYLSKGHLPGEGPYGRQIELAIDYV